MGGAVAAGAVLEVQITGRGGVPTDAVSAVVNVTMVGPAADGFATVFPDGAVPEASSVNYRAGQDTANELVVKLSPTGSLRIYTWATSHVLVDVVGYM